MKNLLIALLLSSALFNGAAEAGYDCYGNYSKAKRMAKVAAENAELVKKNYFKAEKAIMDDDWSFAREALDVSLILLKKTDNLFYEASELTYAIYSLCSIDRVISRKAEVLEEKIEIASERIDVIAKKIYDLDDAFPTNY